MHCQYPVIIDKPREGSKERPSQAKSEMAMRSTKDSKGFKIKRHTPQPISVYEAFVADPLDSRKEKVQRSPKRVFAVNKYVFYEYEKVPPNRLQAVPDIVMFENIIKIKKVLYHCLLKRNKV